MSCCKRCVGTLRDVLCRAAEHQGLLQQAVQTADVSDVKRLLQHIPVKRRYATCLGPKVSAWFRPMCFQC